MSVIDYKYISTRDQTILDLIYDANEFIQIPSHDNILYAQIGRTRIRLLIQFGVSKFKTILRSKIEHQIYSKHYINIFDVCSIISISCPKSSTPANSLIINHKMQSAHFNSTNMDFTNSTEIEPLSENNKTRQILIADIETLLIKILHDITTDNNIKLLIPNSKKWENFEIKNGILTIKDLPNVSHNTVSFKYMSCRHHLALILYILSEVYHLLITNTTCAERELYYDNPELGENQLKVKSVIRDVCCILKVSPWDLGIRSSSKGLIAGAIRVHMFNHVVIDCYMYDGASLIPDVQCIRLVETTAKFVLIIEKDTIFEKLLKQNILLDIHSDIILITGKGYPDLNTRLLIKRIWNDFRLPIYAIVDADPFGIDIMLVYRYGSRAMALNSDQLACPEIRWIGIHPSEIEILAIPSIPLSKQDKKKISELLQRTYTNAQIRNELEILRRLNCKAEIEGVTRFSENFLVSEYIPNKIKRNLVL